MERYNQKRVVVIDDDEMVLSALKRFLQTLGFKVYTATCVTEGIKLVMDFYPHLIITDIDLGYLNGVDFYQVMKQHELGDKCLFITGYSNQLLDKHYHLPLEMKDKLINKPFNYTELTQKMITQLGTGHVH